MVPAGRPYGLLWHRPIRTERHSITGGHCRCQPIRYSLFASFSIVLVVLVLVSFSIVLVLVSFSIVSVGAGDQSDLDVIMAVDSQSSPLPHYPYPRTMPTIMAQTNHRRTHSHRSWHRHRSWYWCRCRGRGWVGCGALSISSAWSLLASRTGITPTSRPIIAQANRITPPPLPIDRAQTYDGLTHTALAMVLQA